MMSKDQTCPGSSLLLSLLVSNLKRPVATLAVLAVLALSACSAPASRDAVYDPAQPFNCMSHGVNKGVDRVLLRPASQLYAAAVPTPVAAGVNNLASNLSEPSAVVNDVLQGNLEDGIHTTFRFLLNSTVGFAGLFDVASSIGLEKRESDFGETLHVWGAGEGAYLELPFLGPSTTRDFVGVVVDGAMNPTLHAKLDEILGIPVACSAPSALLDSIAHPNHETLAARLTLAYGLAARFDS